MVWHRWIHLLLVQRSMAPQGKAGTVMELRVVWHICTGGMAPLDTPGMVQKTREDQRVYGTDRWYSGTVQVHRWYGTARWYSGTDGTVLR